MRQIWKFTLALQESQTVPMPKGARILTVQMQGRYPCLWAVVDPGMEREARVFQIIGTGHPTEEAAFKNYVGTWQDGPMVWHLFEREVGR